MADTDFQFELPEALIAQAPLEERAASRLMHLAPDGSCEDLQFKNLSRLVQPGDRLVFNDTRVLPARAYGEKDSGGRIELLLERVLEPTLARVQLKASKSPKPGGSLRLDGGVEGEVEGRDGPFFVVRLHRPWLDYLEEHGHVPLPPYIARPDESADRERYQTVYAKHPGAVAAPTAGLHFDDGQINHLRSRGVEMSYVTLHVGAGTFQPLRAEQLERGELHAEQIQVSRKVCDEIADTRSLGGRIVAVGTTVMRALETAALDGELAPFSGESRLFIRPGFEFRVADALLTNFHLPGSSLMMLVGAFAGSDALMAAYRHAIDQEYRFYSYGDAMFCTGASMAFELLATDGNARRGLLRLPRGDVRTPAFMPVGTYGTVKAMTPEEVRELGADIILGNTFHLMLRPGSERVQRLGGLHRFMNWTGPILTDSGGFQVWSLTERRKLTEEGVRFQAPTDGSTVFLTPERSMQVQAELGSDIQMILDECTDYPATESDARRSMELSLRWAARSRSAFDELGSADRGSVVFGIVQGGMYPELRRASLEGLLEIGFDGMAIGGLSVGEPRDERLLVLDVTLPLMPADSPRYLMGVGTPTDLLDAVERGVDMFDCVLPTRNARNGHLFTEPTA